ncbi:MAG: AAA family ATPase [Muribaculaceae bacterium]|nr:AAA family ATPase [Muribaculaceae bacterium]
MKLKLLEIHNIASIADACIDFESEPLASASVFLISGPTGAGKSTILDAICLALYDAVPRMERTRMRGRADDADTFNPDADDTRQLLTQGASEGYARLTFEANNGKVYMAEWSTSRTVRRSKDSEAGKIKNRCRYLKCLSDPTEPELDKLTQVNKRVVELCGLTYEQFCRTTMLAQGEFANFLLSDNKSKADILEKITGKDIYARIGKQIFTEYRDRESELKALEQQRGHITVLSAEERESKLAEVQKLGEEIDKLRAESARLQAISNWLTRRAELSQRAEAEMAAEKRALEATESDEYKSRSVLVAQWDATADVRRSLADRKSLETEALKIERSIAALKEEYGAYLAAKEALVMSGKECADRLASLTAKQESYGGRATAFEHAAEINEFLARVCDAGARRKAALDRMATEESKLPAMNEALVKAQESLASRVVESEKAAEAVDNCRKQLEKYDYDDLTHNNTATTDRLEALKNILNGVRAIADTVEKIDADRRALYSLSRRNEELTVLLPLLERNSTEAAEALDSALKLYELVAATVEEKANTLRTKLVPGCKCPVCLQAVELVVEPDIEAESALRKGTAAQLEAAKAKKIEADKILEETQKESIRISVQLKSEAERLDRLAAETTAKEKELKLQMQEHGVDVESLESAINSCIKTLAAIRQALEEREAVNKEVNRLQTLATAAKDKMIEAQTKVNEAAGELKLTQNKRDEAVKVANVEKITAEEAEKELLKVPGVDAFVGGKSFDAPAIKTTFSAELKEYMSVVEQVRAIERTVDENRKLLGRLSNYELVLPWQDVEANGTLHEDIESCLLRITRKFSADIALLTSTKEGIKACDTAISAFLSGNEGFTTDLLEKLAAMDVETIEMYRKSNSIIDDALKQARLNLARTRIDLDKHESERPDFDEDTTVEKLSGNLASINISIDGHIERRGQLAQQLSDDEKNKTAFEDLLRRIEVAENVLSKWKRLNDMLGDSTGEKFKRIALGFILGVLLNKANEYLRRLTDRYSLVLIPGTYNIDVVDHHKGDTQRSANTGSGGESFMISLALALALSDVSPSLAVDILFIDEGFSTLSDEPLANVVALLTKLHKDSGRRVGIISHVDALRKEIDVQIRVEKNPASATSRLRTTASSGQ